MSHIIFVATYHHISGGHWAGWFTDSSDMGGWTVVELNPKREAARMWSILVSLLSLDSSQPFPRQSIQASLLPYKPSSKHTHCFPSETLLFAWWLEHQPMCITSYWVPLPKIFISLTWHQTRSWSRPQAQERDLFWGQITFVNFEIKSPSQTIEIHCV